jgi:hypothetical protein
MRSLAECLKLHGFTNAESTLVKRSAKEYIKEGHSAREANEAAITNFIDRINNEKSSVIKQVNDFISANPEKTTAKPAVKEKPAAGTGEAIPKEARGQYVVDNDTAANKDIEKGQITELPSVVHTPESFTPKGISPVEIRIKEEMSAENRGTFIEPKTDFSQVKETSGINFGEYNKKDLESFISVKLDELNKLADTIEKMPMDEAHTAQLDYSLRELQLKDAYKELSDRGLKDIETIGKEKSGLLEDDLAEFDVEKIEAEQDTMSSAGTNRIMGETPTEIKDTISRTSVELDKKRVTSDNLDLRSSSIPAYKLVDGTLLTADTVTDLNQKLFSLDISKAIGAEVGWSHEGNFIPERMLSKSTVPASKIVKKHIGPLLDIIGNETGGGNFGKETFGATEETIQKLKTLRGQIPIIQKAAKSSGKTVEQYLRDNGVSEDGIDAYKNLLTLEIRSGEVMGKATKNQKATVHAIASDIKADLDKIKISLGLTDAEGKPKSMSKMSYDEAALLEARMHSTFAEQRGETVGEMMIKRILDTDKVGPSTLTKSWETANGVLGKAGAMGRDIMDAIHSPDRVFKSPEGKLLYKEADRADILIQREHEHVYADHGLGLEREINKLKSSPELSQRVAHALEGRLTDNQLSPIELSAVKKFRSYYEYMMNKAIDVMAKSPAEATMVKAIVAKEGDKIKYNSREDTAKVKAIIDQYKNTYSLSKGAVEAIELLRAKEKFYMPHVFDKKAFVDTILAKVYNLENSIKDIKDPEKRKATEDKIAGYKATIDGISSERLISYNQIPKELFFAHFENRKGLPGYKMDAAVAFESYHQGILKKLYLEPWLEKAKGLYERMPPEERPYAKAYIQDMMGWNKRSPLASFVKQFEWMRTLGLNPRSAINNLIGGTFNTMSAGWGEGGMLGVKNYALQGITKAWTPKGIAEFRATGIPREIPQFSLDDVGGLNSRMEKVRYVTGFMFNAAEFALRNTAYHTGKAIAEAKGLKGEDAFFHAVDFVHQTQFRYGKVGMPMGLRGWGGVVFQYSSYPVKQFEFMGSIFRDVKENPKVGIPKALSFMLLNVGAPILAYNLGADITNAAGFGADWGDLYNFAKDMTKGEWEDAGRHWSMAWSRGNGIFPNAPPLGPAMKILTELSGTEDGKWWSVLKELEPLQVQAHKVRDFWMALKHESGGRYPVFKYDNNSIFSQPIEKKYSVSLPQLYNKTFGPKPSAETEVQRVQFNNMLMEKEIQTITSKFYKAIEIGDGSTIARLVSQYPSIVGEISLKTAGKKAEESFIKLEFDKATREMMKKNLGNKTWRQKQIMKGND